MEIISRHIVFKKMLKFFDEHQINLHSNFLLSISGGRDSMCLFFLFLELKKIGKIKNFRAIHFNHKARAESFDEAKIMKNIFIENNIDFEIIELDLDLKNGSFEQVAREARYGILDKILKPNEICLLGHHLDDHFEWAMMRFFRSGENDFITGMPNYRFPYCRPLSDVSRLEINNFISEFNIQFLEDKTNSESHADRNFIRNNISPLIRERFPHYLEFFLSRKNERLVLIKNQIVDNNIIFRHSEFFTILFFDQNLKPNNSPHLKSAIKLMSSTQRGSIDREVQKLITAFNSNKTGPMQFSGKVLCWINNPFLIFFRENQIPIHNFIQIDSLKSVSKEQFLELLRDSIDLTPLVKVRDLGKKELNSLKIRKIPLKLTDLEGVFSIGDIYNALSSSSSTI